MQSIISRPALPDTVTLAELSQILKRSVPSLHRDVAAGRLPAGLQLGRTRRWLRSEIEAWLAAGCPDRQSWEAAKEQGRRA